MIEIVAGTYEELSLGYRLKDDSQELDAFFTDHSHSGCLRAVAVSSNGILATGSSDELIRLFNLRRNKELGSLIHHEGTITWLEFFSNSHMFSCSNDGNIGLWNTKTWECLKTFRGHKGAVHCCSFHPSGKLALSVGADKTLRLWNLINGRSAYTTNLKEVAELVHWSPCGDKYLIVQVHKITVYKTEGATLEREIRCTSRIHSITFSKDGTLYVGLDDGTVVSYNIDTGDLIRSNKVHTNRVKGLVMLDCDDEERLVTASSDSYIKIWDVQSDKDAELLSEIDTKFRLTCLGAWYRKTKKKASHLPDDMEAEDDTMKKRSEDTEDSKNPKRSKVTVTYDNEDDDEGDKPPQVGDKLAQRLMKKSKNKKKKSKEND